MANLFEHKDRRVVPNWRSFGNTIVLGELNSFQKERIIPLEEVSIESYIIDWKFNKTVIHASDLLSAALVNNFKTNKDVIEAAKYILQNSKVASVSQISLANKILNNSEIIDLSAPFNSVTLQGLHSFTNTQPIWQKIRETKQNIKLYPFNPVFYVELSRYYSILGLKEKSVSAMKIALHLGSNNRFILRSATRLFAHFGELDYAHDILRKNPLTNFDPWLISAEISIATIRKRTSKFMKKGMELINSSNISPFNFTELASSLGTVELLNGSTKKSRELFNKSMIAPNDNSLAQIEWASQKDIHLEVNPESFPVKLNYEALALDNFQNEKYDLAIDNAARWFIDMPFSKRPILFGSNLASTILKDQEKSIAFLNAGLISHPNDPQLLNNYAYALALDNKAKEALEQLNKIKSDMPIEGSTKICLTATKGLAFFRSGFPELGRNLYLDAIEETKSIHNATLNWIAILNYAREEILIGSEYIDNVMDAVGKIPKDAKDIEIKILREDVIQAFENYKSKPKE